MLYREGALNEKIDVDLFRIDDVWEQSIEHGESAVGPEKMNERAIETVDKYPDKRLVVHYIQPHIPFIGEVGREQFDEPGDPIWQLAMEGKLGISDETLWTAYEENARIALEAVSKVVPELPGKTVITSDHGQMIGDRSSPIPSREYGHPPGIYTEHLVKVPWFVCQFEQRRDTVPTDPDADYDRKRTDELDEKAHEHLQDLGYL